MTPPDRKAPERQQQAETVNVDPGRLQSVRTRNARRRFDAECDRLDLVEAALEDTRAEVVTLRQAVADRDTEISALRETVESRDAELAALREPAADTGGKPDVPADKT